MRGLGPGGAAIPRLGPGVASAAAYSSAARNGTAQRPDNVRSRILAPVHARANELLGKDGRLPIAHMTPHTLRRTFASILAAANVPPRRAMYLLGHTDARLTLSVYQQIRHGGRLDRRPGGRAGCSLLEACDVMAGRVS